MNDAAVAIVGAGFSGTMLALALLDLAPAGTVIHLIDPSGDFGPGLAYGTTHPGHRLNVPAERMSAYPDKPSDFTDWLAAAGTPAPGPGFFAPRACYGAYLSERLQQAVRHRPGIRLHRDRADDLMADRRGIAVRCASGQVIQADAAVLAIGNLAPLPPCDTAALEAAGLWRGDAWSAGSLTGLDADAPVLLIGTGLTMADAVIALLDGGHRGPIHALSRRGLLPRAHLDHPAPPAALPRPLPCGLTALTRLLRLEAARALAAGEAWQPVIDAMRPSTQALWRGLSAQEQARFLRHLRSWWDIYRHRMPPAVAERIQDARIRGQLRVHAGRILGATVVGAMAEVAFCRRGQTWWEATRVARVVNCTGPACDLERAGDPLLRALFSGGIARADRLRLGIEVEADGAVSGPAADRLFAVGPLTKGRWWEMTAVPDIRQQCRDVARAISDRIAPANGMRACEQQFLIRSAGRRTSFATASS